MRIRDCIYLDHNATTPVDQRVLAEMIPYFRESFGNPHSHTHALGWAAAAAVERAAASVGRLVGADADEIIFTSGATESNNLALRGLANVHSKRRRILVCPTDHKSVLETALALGFEDCEVEYLQIDSNGAIDFERSSLLVDERVFLISASLVNSEIGTVQNAARLAELAHASGAYLLLDAAQAPCAMDISNLAREADLVSLSGHKIYGPKGIGALYVARSLQASLAPLVRGGGQQRNLRSGTIPVPLCVGMAKAAEIIIAEGAAERSKLAVLRDSLLNQLSDLAWLVKLNGPNVNRHPGNLNVRFEGFDAENILSTLQPRLAASTGSACTSGAPEPSYVLRAIGLTHDDASASVRFGIGRDTTEQDIADAVVLIESALERISLDAA